jgi:putative phosphoesterase
MVRGQPETMQIAALADIHANAYALDAVVAAIADMHVDLVVNLGDSVSGAVDPVATIATLRDHPDFVTVRGNHERQLLTLAASEMGNVDRIADLALGAEDRRWLDRAEAIQRPQPRVVAFHGGLGDDTCHLLHTVDSAGLREASDDEVIGRLGDEYGCHDLYLCAHTHLQRVRRLPDGSLVVNPGSVGWPAYADTWPYPHVVEAGTPHARFTLLEQAGDGWTALEFSVEYDFEMAAAKAEGHGREDIAYALRHGRVRVA